MVFLFSMLFPISVIYDDTHGSRGNAPCLFAYFFFYTRKSTVLLDIVP